ncbi:hypothetical protein Pcinc_025841 [Petrolisthes cinctipes]|uniref:CUB domain-containing protein n=1 Tax=Petrolisthes cinctipes TaxID=88211 RepID=A0AAE1F9Q4_PETCI|nr:hypothetical protein Pcinc_025841 [Petrolisthes cinctipes]
MRIGQNGNWKAVQTGSYAEDEREFLAEFLYNTALPEKKTIAAADDDNDDSTTLSIDQLTWPHGERGVGECGGEFWDLSGIVTSPNYPYNYPNAITCIYQIKVPSQYTVGLDCNDVSIQPGDNQCENDYLLVYDGHHPDGIRYCGDKALGIFSSGSNITLIFTSDQSYRYRGFMCRYRALRPDGTGTGRWTRDPIK